MPGKEYGFQAQGEREGEGILNFFFWYVGLDPASTVYPKQYQ